MKSPQNARSRASKRFRTNYPTVLFSTRYWHISSVVDPEPTGSVLLGLVDMDREDLPGPDRSS
jgi:hypothetical protein